MQLLKRIVTLLIPLMLLSHEVDNETYTHSQQTILVDKKKYSSALTTEQPLQISNSTKKTTAFVDLQKQSLSRQERTNEIGRLSENNAELIFDSTSATLKNQPGISILLPSSVHERIFFLSFENDIFVEKDYYFTNGACIGFVDTSLERFFPHRIFPQSNSGTANHYGLSLRQNMYTPVNPEALTIVEGDRPFAGILIASFFKNSTDPSKKLTITSELQLGVIGKASLASLMQENMHELHPNGWKYQISNDILINYNLGVNKLLLQSRTMQFNVTSALKAGTYLSKASLGITLSIVPLHGYFKNRPQNGGNIPEISSLYLKQSPLVFYGGFNFHMIGYDATLLGGMFNKKSPYTIKKSKINRFISEVFMCLAFVSRNHSIGIKLVYLSPEFKGGRPHQWGSISLSHIF